MSEPLSQFVPQSYPKRNYYIVSDIRVHNKANDCWVSFFNKVYDLTHLVQSNINSPFVDPIIRLAGQDITFWFDSRNKQPRTKIDPETGKQIFFCPSGQYLHLENHNSIPWWQNEDYCIGKLSHKSRKINIINMITDHQDVLEIAQEETINEILDRYLKINVHADSYVWKRLGKPLDMNMTLTENEVFDETSEYESLGISEDKWYIPAIHLYFNDDLTFA